MTLSPALLKELGRQLVAPRGRCNRQGFLALAIVLLCVQAIGALALTAAGIDLGSGTAALLNAPLVWIGGIALLKRLHDIGRSGWWVPAAVTFWLAGCFLIAVAITLIAGPDRMQAALEHKTLLFWFVFAATTLPAFGGLLWVHAAPGETAANRFGDVPGRFGFSLPSHVAGMPENALAA